jgi:hypothetical protein
MAPRTGRVYFKGLRGRTTCNINWPGVINFRSVVSVTAAEYDPIRIDMRIPLPGLPLPYPPQDDFFRIAGAADIWVSDISPHGPGGTDPGGVTFVVTVNWRDPLWITADITVFDPVVDRIFL